MCSETYKVTVVLPEHNLPLGAEGFPRALISLISQCASRNMSNTACISLILHACYVPHALIFPNAHENMPRENPG